MKIIKIPHPTLRLKAKPINKIDKKTYTFINDLKKTLGKTKNPKGVGLAAPQVGKLWRTFITRFDNDNNPNNDPFTVFINPIIVKHSQEQVVGPKPDKPRMEGCLSMPQLWGPVPRWQWIDIEFQTLQNKVMIPKKMRFDNFEARVVQHELDHLDGILFTDYSLEYGLPVYTEDDNDEMVEIEDRSILESY